MMSNDEAFEPGEYVPPPKLYTLFRYYHSNFIHGAEDRQGAIEFLPWMDSPNAPRLSLDGMQGIVTGVYEFSSAQHLTQTEAEALIQTAQWTNESMENAP